MIEFKVLQTNSNGDVEMWNIFNNMPLRNETKKLIKEYKTKKMSFRDFTYELQSLIMWQEWSRCEYELCVLGWPYRDDDEPVKTDAYYQAQANIKLIAKLLLEDAYPRLKIKPEEMDFKIDYWCHKNGNTSY